MLLERKLTRRRQGLEEIEFKTLCQQLPKNQFASRDWLFERLYEHLLSDDRRTSLHGVVVTGRTGCGKSVLIQELLWPRYFPCAQESRKDILRQQITKSILVHHICSTSNKQTLSLSGYVLNLAAVLINCKHFERYAKFLLQRRDIANLLSREAIEQDPSFALTEGITKPLKNLCDKLIYTPEQFLIVIDVCEQPCHDVENESISSFLAKHLHQFPSWCKFLIAGSEKSLGDIINRGNFQWIKLDDISSWDIQRDIYGFTEMCCKRFPELHKTLTQRERGELIEVVVRGSLGSFTHANLLLCFLQSNLNTQPRTTTYTLIEELDDLLMIIFRREFCGSERSRILTLGLLEASCVSEDFLTDTQLYRVVESGCSSHSITQEEYCNCIEKLIAVQILGKSVDDKIFVTDSARNWLCKRGVAEMGFNLK